MRLSFFVAVALLAATGCTSSIETAASSENALVSFPAAPFQSSLSVSYGKTKSLNVPSNGYAALKFAGNANDSISIDVTDNETYRTPHTFLAEKRSNGTYGPVLGTPLTATGSIQYRLAKTQEYFIVVKSSVSFPTTFSVKLGSETLCSGAPRTFTATDLAKRIATGMTSLTLDGRFDGDNIVTTRAVIIRVGETVVDFGSIVPGMRIDFGSGKVVSSDPTVVAQTHLEMTDECVGVETPNARFVGWLPRAMSHPPASPVSPPFDCESEATITDDSAILERFAAGAHEKATQTASQQWTEWRCTSLTGCLEREGFNNDRVNGWVGIDENTQDVYFRLAHKHENQHEPGATLAVTNGTFTWGNYKGRITQKHIVLTATQPYSATHNGVTESAEYRMGYCVSW